MSVFTGDIYDVDGNEIDCQFTLHHVESGAVSDNRNSELAQFTVDTDDEDINDGGQAFIEGDIAILHHWTDTACAVTKIIGDGSDSYVYNVQLLECVAPTAALTVNDDTINSTVTASQLSSDQYQWEFEETTHHHRADWYGEVLCDGVGIDTVEYDWEDGFTTDNTHSYTEIGEYTVVLRVTNKCGLDVEVNKSVTIKYNQPTVELSNDPVNPKKNEDTTITVTTTDTDSTIVSQTYYIDDTETTELTHAFEEVVTHEFRVVTVWNDGYDDQQMETILLIEMENVGPEVDLTYIVGEDGLHTMNTEIVLGDAEIETIRYIVHYKLPLSGEVVQCANKLDDEQVQFTLLNSGEYTVQVVVTDELGAIGTDTEIIIIETDIGDCDNSETMYIEWE